MQFQVAWLGRIQFSGHRKAAKLYADATVAFSVRLNRLTRAGDHFDDGEKAGGGEFAGGRDGGVPVGRVLAAAFVFLVHGGGEELVGDTAYRRATAQNSRALPVPLLFAVVNHALPSCCIGLSE